MLRIMMAAVAVATAISFVTPAAIPSFNSAAEAQEAQKKQKKKHKNKSMVDPRKSNRR